MRKNKQWKKNNRDDEKIKNDIITDFANNVAFFASQSFTIDTLKVTCSKNHPTNKDRYQSCNYQDNGLIIRLKKRRKKTCKTRSSIAAARILVRK